MSHDDDYNNMNQRSIIMLAVLTALGVVLVAGLIAIPAIDEAHARSSIASARNKGQQGFVKSGGQGGRLCGSC
jgi:uncharacterized membrane protein YjgN (DUF898 family)